VPLAQSIAYAIEPNIVVIAPQNQCAISATLLAAVLFEREIGPSRRCRRASPSTWRYRACDDTVSVAGPVFLAGAGGGVRALTVSPRAVRAFGLRAGGRAGMVQHELPLAARAGRG
jgi:hypothetical protein